MFDYQRGLAPGLYLASRIGGLSWCSSRYDQIIAFQLQMLGTQCFHLPHVYSSLSKKVDRKIGWSTFTSRSSKAADAPVRVEGLIVMLTKPWVKLTAFCTDSLAGCWIFDEPRKIPDTPSYNILEVYIIILYILYLYIYIYIYIFIYIYIHILLGW